MTEPRTRTPVASPPGGDVVLDRPAAEPTRVVDALLGAFALVAVTPSWFPNGLSVGLLVLAVTVAVGATRRPVRHLTGAPYRLGWFVPLMLTVFAFAVAVSIATPDDSINGWPRRALRLVLVMAFLLVVVSGRIHYPSFVRGLAAGLAANAALFEAGLAPTPYGDYLSGFLLDKNVAGLAYTVTGLLLVGLTQRTSSQLVILTATSWLVWTTGSRTSIAALACGIAWLLLRPHLGRFGRLALAAVLAAAIQVIETRYARVGVFANRDGTDALRQRIDAASSGKVEDTPWPGQGLGSAYVFLDGRTFLFHNSYWSAFVEGGWVLAVAYVAVTLLVGVGLLRPGRATRTWAAAEAANVAVLVCALRLGEVFGTTTGMLALGAGLLGAMAARRAAEPPPPDTPTESPAALGTLTR
ncbi:ABC transporter permease [uncultured Phycicoccus sp.]|uniref:ABC transporter permease n=1 Tax=uncultured Phycicoccus sp. TaxID=661422 RepID=UPI002633CDB5|nr:ABC transporter permease [uncultured Phycicoccus sp.]